MLFSFSIWRRASIVSLFIPSPYSNSYIRWALPISPSGILACRPASSHDYRRPVPTSSKVPCQTLLPSTGDPRLDVDLLAHLRLEVAPLPQRPLETRRTDLQRVRPFDRIGLVERPSHHPRHPAAQIVRDPSGWSMYRRSIFCRLLPACSRITSSTPSTSRSMTCCNQASVSATTLPSSKTKVGPSAPTLVKQLGFVCRRIIARRPSPDKARPPITEATSAKHLPQRAHASAALPDEHVLPLPSARGSTSTRPSPAFLPTVTLTGQPMSSASANLKPGSLVAVVPEHLPALRAEPVVQRPTPPRSEHRPSPAPAPGGRRTGRWSWARRCPRSSLRLLDRRGRDPRRPDAVRAHDDGTLSPRLRPGPSPREAREYLVPSLKMLPTSIPCSITRGWPHSGQPSPSSASRRSAYSGWKSRPTTTPTR